MLILHHVIQWLPMSQLIEYRMIRACRHLSICQGARQSDKWSSNMGEHSPKAEQIGSIKKVSTVFPCSPWGKLKRVLIRSYIRRKWVIYTVSWRKLPNGNKMLKKKGELKCVNTEWGGGGLYITASNRSTEALHYLTTASVMMKSNGLKIPFSMLLVLMTKSWQPCYLFIYVCIHLFIYYTELKFRNGSNWKWDTITVKNIDLISAYLL